MTQQEQEKLDLYQRLVDLCFETQEKIAIEPFAHSNEYEKALKEKLQIMQQIKELYR